MVHRCVFVVSTINCIPISFYQPSLPSKVVLNGRLRVHFSPTPLTGTLKIDLLDFSSRGYTEYIPRNALHGLSKHDSLKKDNKNISSKLDAILREILPESLVNDFGICPRVMRCLEVTAVSQTLSFCAMSVLTFFFSPDRGGCSIL